MKKAFVLCVACLIAFALVASLGCSKKEEKAPSVKEEMKAKTGMKAALFDPVDKQPVDISTTPYYYVYNDVEYYFNSKDNMEEFKKDPAKYVGTGQPVRIKE